MKHPRPELDEIGKSEKLKGREAEPAGASTAAASGPLESSASRTKTNPKIGLGPKPKSMTTFGTELNFPQNSLLRMHCQQG